MEVLGCDGVDDLFGEEDWIKEWWVWDEWEEVVGC